MRFKVHGTEADWLTEDRQGDSWAGAQLITETSVWEIGSDVKNSLTGRIPRNIGR